MGKGSGNTRSIAPTSKNHDKAYSEYRTELDSGKYEIENSYFSESGLGAVLFQKGHNYHREEIDCAKILADNGFVVTLQPEDGTGVSLKAGKNGGMSYPEGKVDMYWFEQHTSNTSGDNTVYKGLQHAHEKGAEIAVIYDEGGFLHRNNIQNGIDRYNMVKFRTPKTIFKAILVVSKKNHDWHEWRL